MDFSKFSSESFVNITITLRRYVHNAELFEKIHESVISLADITKTFVGGNAPVMANRMANDGAIVLLGAKLSESQISFLNKNVSGVLLICDLFI